MVALPKWLRLGPRRSVRAQANPSDPAVWTTDAQYVGYTPSGELVTSDRALRVSAYYACLNNGSQDVAKLPVRLRERVDGRRGSVVVYGDPLAFVLRQANPLQTWGVFARLMQHRVMAWGNAYAEVERNQLGEAVALWPLHPGRVTPRLDGASITYHVREDSGRERPMGSRDVFHLRGLGDGIEGYSVLRIAAEALGLAIAAQKHAGAFYGEGMGKRMVAIAKGPTLSPEGREQLRKRIMGDRERNPVGWRKLAIIDGIDVDLRDAGIPPDEAQFLEQREFSVEDIARFFRMALAKLQYHKRAAGWGTLDALNTDYAVDFIQPWVRAWEEELWAKAIREDQRDRRFVKFSMQALMRGDSASRTATYTAGLQNGWLSPNDVRELEDMDPIEDPAADEYRTQMQMVPLSGGDDDDEREVDQAASASPPPFPVVPTEDADGAEDPNEARSVTDTAPVSGVGTLLGAADRMRDAVREIARRMVRIEATATARAVRRHASDAVAFGRWESEFYASHAATVADAFAPTACALEAVAEQYGVSGVGTPADLMQIVATYRDGATLRGMTEDAATARLADVAMTALIGGVKEASHDVA